MPLFNTNVIIIDLRLYTIGLIALVVLSPILLPILNRIFINMWEPNKIFRKKSKTFVKRKYIPFNETKFKIADPTFNKIEFQSKVFNIYQTIQTAWMNFDYNTIRKYTTDEMYNMYKSLGKNLKKKRKTNITKDFALKYFNISGMEITKDNVSLTVFVKMECYNYVINQKGKVVRGNKNKKILQHLRMTFIKGINKEKNKCPNCGAPLPNINSSTCQYCGSVIYNENHDWILSEKLVLSQKSVQKKNMDQLMLSIMKNKNTKNARNN